MESITEQNTQEEVKDSKSQKPLKLCYGLPFGICTKEEHKDAIARAKAYYKEHKKREIEQHKRELARAREEIKIIKEQIKIRRTEKFKQYSYAEWVRKIREENKGYKKNENEDSIKIK
jgi:hypothetical protein